MRLLTEYRAERDRVLCKIRAAGYDPAAIILRARVSNWWANLKHAAGNVWLYYTAGLVETTNPLDIYRTYAPEATAGQVNCHRCYTNIPGSRLPDGGMTAGYYDVQGEPTRRRPEGWAEYAKPGERFVCDACMWADPRYIATYGQYPDGQYPVGSYSPECMSVIPKS